jgi:O-antigen ligase
MSAWPSQLGRLPPQGHSLRHPGAPRRFSFSPRLAISVGCLTCLLAVQGVAITQSYLWAAPLLCLLLVAIAVDLPVVPLVGLLLLVRVLTDDLSSTASRHSTSVNSSAAIAALFILLALGLIIRRRQALWPAALATLWLCVWTGVAVNTHGASTLDLREGVREASVVALAVIVCNSRGELNLALAARLIQLAGLASAFIALYQLAKHTGQLVGGEIRSNGTFSQPNAAAVFFAVATTASVWRFIDVGRRRADALFALVYAAATIATFSLGGLAGLLVMLMALGLLRPGSSRVKLGSCAVAGLVIIAFLATPLGSERISEESSATNLNTLGIRGTSNSSLGWRLSKWKSLIPEWERAPLFGRGLGTTIIAEGTASNGEAEALPHSELVRYLVETGLVGLVALLTGLVMLLRRLTRRSPERQIDGGRTLAIAVLLGLLVNALVANTLLYTPATYAATLIIVAALSSPSTAARAARRGTAQFRKDPSFA